MQPPSNRFAPSTAVTRRLAAVAIAVACSGGCKPHVPALPSPESARATEGSPALKLVDRSRGDASACQIGVDAHGLPALNPDGTRVAFVEYPWCGYDDEAGCGSDLVIVPTSDGTRESRRRLEDSTRELGAYPEETDAEQCREIRERHRQRADRFTAELRGFRPLQALDVVVVDPDRLGEVDPSYIVPIADLPAAHRPVSVAVDGLNFPDLVDTPNTGENGGPGGQEQEQATET